MRLNLLRLSPVLVLIFLVSCGGGGNQSAQNNSNASPSPGAGSGPDAAVATRSYTGVGTVTALDPKAPSIKIDHGDIEGLMPAMEMEFDVPDAALLNGLQVNDQIDFTIEDRIGVMRVTAIKKR